MKKIYLLLISTIAMAQIALAQTKPTTITFDIGAKTIAVNGKKVSGSLITIPVSKGGNIVFVVTGIIDTDYKLKLSVGSKFKTLTNKHFKKGRVKTDNRLNYNGLSLATQFKIDILPTGIHQGFKVQMNATNPDYTSNELKPDKSQDSSVINVQGSTSDYQPGFAYYDAFSLKNYKNLSQAALISILQQYNKGNATEAQLDSMIDNNPFFKRDAILAKGLKAAVTKADTVTKGNLTLHGATSVVSNTISSIGGLDVTNIADGTAKFLIKRGKEELSIAFFTKFKDVLNKNKDLKILFPNTVNLLNEIDEDIYDYDNYLQNLREAFKKDISALPTDLPGIVDGNQTYFKKHYTLAAELLGACYVANQIENHAHPGDIIANFPDSLLNKFSRDTLNKHYFKGGFQTLQLLSWSLRDSTTTDNASYWINVSKIRKLVNDPDAFNIFLGLLYQQTVTQYNNIAFDTVSTHNLQTILTQIAPHTKNYAAYKTYILGLGNRIDALNKMITNNQNTKADSSTVEVYANYFKTVVSVLSYCSSVSDLPWDDNSTIEQAMKIDFHTEFSPYFDISDHTADLAIDISKKNYSAAINEAVYVYNKITVKPVIASAPRTSSTDSNKTAKKVNKQIKKLEKITKKALPTSLADEVRTSLETPASLAANNTTTAINNVDTAKNNLSVLIKYSTFMASVATAKNSDDVESAIEAAALPPGSYSIKQRSKFNISVNGYVGYAFDFKSFPFKTLYANGIYAPIGFSFSKGMWGDSPSKLPKFTIFASLIDVGNLVSYRLSNATDTLKQQVRLESIFSPSLHLVYNIPNWPLSIAMGWRRTPKLFYSGQQTFLPIASRNVFNASLLIDIPLFTIYNKKN